jgi:hypothetical protein
MKLRQLRKIALGLGLGLSVLALQVLAQTGQASLTGTVRDAGGAVVSAAAVTVTNSETGVATKAETNAEGIYYLGALPRGPYTLVIEKEGFKKYSGTLELYVGQKAVANANLNVGSTQETVSVTDAAPVITTQSSEISNIKDYERIRQLPLNGREVTLLLNLTPGVEGEGSCNDRAAAGTCSSFRVNGGKVGSLDITVDGISAIDRFGGGAARVGPGLDTVQEFRVETAGSDASYSRPSTVTVSTRSGTNAFHGSLFETHRNNSGGLRVRRREDIPDPVTGVFKPGQLIRNEYGASAGGPLYIPHVYDGRNKTFWFAAFEGLRGLQQSLNTNDENGQRVPTEAMWNGDFSNAFDQEGNKITIYDPLTTASDGTRQAFPGNIIPVDRLNPLGKVLSSITARPSNDTNPYLGSNYIHFYPDRTKLANLTLKADQHFGDKDSLSVRYTRGTRNHTTEGGVFANPASAADGAGTSRSDDTIQDVAVTYNRVVTNNFLNELLVGVHRSFHDQGTLADFTDWAGQLGLPNPFGVNGWPTFCAYNLGYYYGFCWDADNHSNQALTAEVLDDNATWTRGKHTLKFGGRIRLEQNNVRELQQAQGSHTFLGDWTANTAKDNNDPRALQPFTGDGLASLLLGLPTILTNQYNRGYFYFRQKELGLYVNDSWKVSPRLTLNLGLRWDKWTPYQEAQNRLTTADVNSILDPTKFEVITPGNHDMHSLPGIPPSVLSSWEAHGLTFNTARGVGYPDSLFAADNNNFGPRIGAAFRITNNTVLRGSYGEYFWTMPLSQLLQASRTNPPLNLRYRNDMNERNFPLDNFTSISAPSAGDFLPTATVDITGNGVISPGAQQETVWDGRNWKDDRIQQWQVTLEHELPYQTAVRVSYLGTHGTDLEQNYSINSLESAFNYAARTGAPPDPNADLRRSNPNWNPRSKNRTGYSNSNSGQVEVEHRFARGVAFQAFYTYIHSLTTTDAGGFSSGGGGINDVLLGATPPENITVLGEPNLSYDQRLRMVYLNSTAVPPHHIRFNGVVDLPFGKGKKIAGNANGFLNSVIGGWQVATIGDWRSGFWRSVAGNKFQSGNPALDADQRVELTFNDRPQRLWFRGDFDPTQATNVTGGDLEALIPADRSQRVVRPFGPDCDGSYQTNRLAVHFADNTCYNAVSGDFFNPGRRANLIGPGAWNTDISIFKNFKFKEIANVRFTADFFNAFNHPNDIDPDAATGLQDLSRQANEPRIIQFSLRVDW